MNGVRARALAALASGVVFAASTPPTNLHAGILVGLVGFALALENAGRMRVAAACGWFFGIGANLVALRFVPEVVMRYTPLGAIAAWAALLLLAAGQALPWAAAGAIASRLARPRVNGARPLSPPWLAYALGVYVATFLPAVFPWTPAGGLTPWPVTVQTAELVGERGTSFLFAIAAGLVAHAVGPFVRSGPRHSRRALSAFLGIGATVLVVMFAWGALRMHQIEAAREAAPHVKVTLVQPGFDAGDRWEATRASMMMDRLSTLTKSAEQRGAELTVWPESAYPYTLSVGTRTSPYGSRAVLQSGVHGPVLTGAYMAGGPGVGYNSAILATTDGALSAPYHKRHLLVFGEAVPFAEWFPWLKKVFAKGTGLSPGRESVVFTAGPIHAAVLNCYEDTLPEAGREAMERAPNLLVNITNDAWFAGSAEGELHLRLAILRAIETRRDLVRAVNQGPTTFVDAAGRVRSRYDLPMPGTLSTSPALLEGPPTLYARFGDLPLLLLALGSVLGPFVATKRRERRSPEEAALGDD